MSADKRSVHTDALATLGTIIDETAARDAIHLAVEPVIAGQELDPGDHIAILNGKAFRSREKALGIVDPFLEHYVKKGQRFWLIVYPRTITSLRHVWEHPAFSKELQEEAVDTESPQIVTFSQFSQLWIRRYADDIGLDYDELMSAADDFVDTADDYYGGQYLVKGGLLEGVSTSNEFWEHYEAVRGVKIDNNKKRNFFSCSC